MKHLIFYLSLAAIFFCTGCKPEKSTYTTTSSKLRIECVDGLTFVVFSDYKKGGLAQMLVLDDRGGLVPATCERNSKWH